jgi:hypothetical protein
MLKGEALVYQLELIGPDGATARYPLSVRPFYVGRGAVNDLILLDDAASTQHFRVWSEALVTVVLALCAGAGLWLYPQGGPDRATNAPLPPPNAAPPEIPAPAGPAPNALAEPVEPVALVAPVALPPVAPLAARTTPASVAPPQPAIVAAPGGPISRLRVGIEAPNGLPADVTLSVTGAGGASAESRSTQVVLPDTTSGRITVSVRSATRTLAEEIVDVPPGVEVRVLCKSLAADFSGMHCSVRE